MGGSIPRTRLGVAPGPAIREPGIGTRMWVVTLSIVMIQRASAAVWPNLTSRMTTATKGAINVLMEAETTATRFRSTLVRVPAQGA